MKANKNYWGNIISVVRSLGSGLRITFNHMLKARISKKPLSIQDDTYFNQAHGIATIQYPHETLPVPDTGRYQLHNEIDDCIVCDKCVKVCPVDCITIEPIRATEEIGRTSDGTPKRIYAAKFDIDMGKCCFCGLCTTVCPTECLTMTKTYDFSTFDIREHNFEFAEMTPVEIKEKKKLLETHQQAKIAAQASNPSPPITSGETTKSPRPVFKPKIKPPDS
jgi:formate hydrogenlyase subunit 6/NADH:ubiquinone oxidoreductase subunit I